MSSTDRLVPVMYHCYGGTHCSVVAAAIRCGLIASSPNAVRTCLDLPWFDRLPLNAAGIPVRIGTDGDGRDIYAVGRLAVGRWMERVVPSVLSGAGLPVPALVDVGVKANGLLKLGGFMSRRLGLGWPGRSVLLRGVTSAWADLAAAAEGSLPPETIPRDLHPTVIILSQRGPESVTVSASGGLRVVTARLGTRAPIARRLIREVVRVMVGSRVRVFDQ